MIMYVCAARLDLMEWKERKEREGKGRKGKEETWVGLDS